MIGSVLKALDILWTFSPAEARLTLGEISSRLGLPKSTAHNLLATLLSRGFVEKADDDHYALGTAIVALAQAVRVNAEVRDRAAPLLRELSGEVRDSVYLAVLDGDYCLYIYAVESPHRLRARTAVGDRAHLHCTAIGKAILANLPKDKVDSLIARVGLPKYTPATLTDPQALHEELDHTRQRGYSLDRGEHELGTYCIGAPIFGEQGQIIGACSVSGVNPDLLDGQVAQVARLVMNTAEEISRRMGYIPARNNLNKIFDIKMT